MDRAAEDMAMKIQKLESHAVDMKDEIQAKFSLEARVAEDPWKVLVAGVGVGFVIGLMSS
jgi:ElaB/YqjD/DUF883 family membrane-anchored ribosome-binding protein